MINRHILDTEPGAILLRLMIITYRRASALRSILGKWCATHNWWIQIGIVNDSEVEMHLNCITHRMIRPYIPHNRFQIINLFISKIFRALDVPRIYYAHNAQMIIHGIVISVHIAIDCHNCLYGTVLIAVSFAIFFSSSSCDYLLRTSFC